MDLAEVGELEVREEMEAAPTQQETILLRRAEKVVSLVKSIEVAEEGEVDMRQQDYRISNYLTEHGYMIMAEVGMVHILKLRHPTTQIKTRSKVIQ